MIANCGHKCDKTHELIVPGYDRENNKTLAYMHFCHDCYLDRLSTSFDILDEESAMKWLQEKDDG